MTLTAKRLAIPSDTYTRLAEDVLSLDIDDPAAADAMLVVLDRAMAEGLKLVIPSVQAYPGARPSLPITITAAMVAGMGVSA